MADAIVQSIKIEVDGADQAANEIKKVGQATEEVQQTAIKSAGGTQEFGKGLDQVSQKSGISSRELRSLSKVAKEFGADSAVVGLSLVRMAAVLGPIGASLFALGLAFSSLKSKMKEVEEAAKAVTQTFANMAKISAEMKAENDAAFWGTTAAEMKKVANEAGNVANQLRNIQARGREPTLTDDTKSLEAGFVKLLEQRGIAVNDVMADTEKLGEESRKAGLEAAKAYEAMSPIQKLNFEKALKGLGFTEDQIKNIEKGSVALKKIQDDAAKFDAGPAGQALKAFDAALKSSQETVGDWGQTLKIKFAEAVLGWKKIFAGGFGFFGEVLAEAGRQIMGGLASIGSLIAQAVAGWVSTAAPAAWQWIVDTFNSAVASLQGLLDQAMGFIEAWVTTPVSSAWQWIADTFTSALASLKGALDQATAAITTWVTTPIANAWQWIVDAWNSMLAKLGFGGAGSGAPASASVPGAAGGGLLGGRGTGTSDSNLAWVSRGEHIMPARAVAQPGVLAFLEALRRSGGNLRHVLDGMGRFALGGLVAPTLSIPAFASGGGMNNVTIQFPGLPEITGLRASSAVVDELRKAAAMAQVRSGGRKPSRYS
jgi:hypothetical protein